MGGVRSCGKGGPHVVWRQLGWGKGGGFNTVEQVGGGGGVSPYIYWQWAVILQLKDFLVSCIVSNCYLSFINFNICSVCICFQNMQLWTTAPFKKDLKQYAGSVRTSNN